ncbi:MAG TPA: L,D-transpeptidase [Solirubrobacteraceae bacterium]
MAFSGSRVGGAVAAVLAAAVVAEAAPAGAQTPAAPTRKLAWIARVLVPTTARTAPGAHRVVGAVGTIAEWNGGPVGLLVLDSRVDHLKRLWLRVALPRRPNGSSGWIPADDARLSTTSYRIEIAVRSRRLRLLHRGRVVLRTRVVVGAPATPTPQGLFAVNERVREPDPHGFLGSWALHLTAFSNVLDDYGGGPGRVAIHGRGGASFADPLGTARSHGCIRLPNSVVERLARVAREGTPVRVVSRFGQISR